MHNSELLDAPWQGHLDPESSTLLSGTPDQTPATCAGNPGYCHSARGDGGEIEAFVSEDLLTGIAALGVGTIGEIGTFGSVEQLGPRFVAGGSFDGFSPVADGTFKVTMPPPEDRWIRPPGYPSAYPSARSDSR